MKKLLDLNGFLLPNNNSGRAGRRRDYLNRSGRGGFFMDMGKKIVARGEFRMKTVSQKMGLKEGMRAFIMNAPQSALEAINLPKLNIGSELRGQFDYLHLFTKSQAEMKDLFPKLQRHLKQGGMLWVSWPKNRQLNTDLVLDRVINIGYSHGLVESICLSVDSTWSGLKFTHPKEGKVYHNSHGQLPR